MSQKSSSTEEPSRPCKKRKIGPREGEDDLLTDSPIAHWARTLFWPEDLWQRGAGMADTPPVKRKSSSSFSHHSESYKRMAKFGISTGLANLMQESSRDLCLLYLEGDRRDVKTSIFTAEQYAKILDRVQYLNEERIKKTVMPLVIPSAEDLFYLDELDVDYIGEEYNTLWNRCDTMGSILPKPDYTAGLLSNAFTEEEISKLEIYARRTRPFLFTAEISFPFLIGEVKQGETGMNTADRQNIHSASIAIRAIIALYRECFGETAPERVNDLYGKVLVFTISHDNLRVVLYGHYAMAAPGLPDQLKFHRTTIGSMILDSLNGADRYKSYNFVCNVYEKFAPEHRKRIKDAVSHLPSPNQTGLSFVASEMNINEAGSQQQSQGMASQDDSVFKKPSGSINSSLIKEVATIKELLKQQQEQAKKREERYREEAKEREERYREEAKEREERLREEAKDTREELMQYLRNK